MLDQEFLDDQEYTELFNLLYEENKNTSDEDLVNLWRYCQHHSQGYHDYDWCMAEVCRRLLLERENHTVEEYYQYLI